MGSTPLYSIAICVIVHTIQPRKMHRFSVLFALAGASLTAAQGFSTECTDISLNNSWLIATCPSGNGDDITSSVFLNSNVGNDGGDLAVRIHCRLK